MEKEFAGTRRQVPTLEQLQTDPDSVQLHTAPFDPRFPNTNQTKNCWQNYVDYQQCRAAKGEDYEPCKYFEYRYKVLCPQGWVARWDELREENKFPGDLQAPSMETLHKMTGH